MIRRVYEQAAQAQDLARLVVATDHEAIAAEVRHFGGEVVMTRSSHLSGTDRCHEALQQVVANTGASFDYVVNIQGDEPFIQPQQINLLTQALVAGKGSIELATMITKATSPAELENNSEVFVTMNTDWEALYFSRFPIPFQQKVPRPDWLSHQTYYKHLGMYAYRADILGEITQLPPSSLEVAESLEQLRWLQHGYAIKLVLTDIESYCIDTPEDLANALGKFI